MSCCTGRRVGALIPNELATKVLAEETARAAAEGHLVEKPTTSSAGLVAGALAIAALIWGIS